MTSPLTPAAMLLSYELIGRCFWHLDCDKSRSGIVREVRREDHRTLVECGHCGRRAYYPVGGLGPLCVPEEGP